MKNFKEQLVSLNTEVSEFDLKELETRLETDPLAVGGLFNVAGNAVSGSDEVQPLWCLWDNECGEHN